MTLLVHGIADAKEAGVLDLDALSSVRGEQVSVVTGGDPPHVALVTEVEDAQVLPSRRMLLAHARLLEEIAASVTVLPLRFGTTVPTAGQLREDYLDGAAAELRSLVDRLRGHAEWRVRGRYDEETTLRAIVLDDARIACLRRRTDRSSQIEMGERVVAALEARRADDGHRAANDLRAHASAVEADAPHEPLEAFSLSALVDLAAASDFEAKVEELAKDLAPEITLELVGPQPPYSFVHEGPAWAS